jgi:hypothetical protein
LGEDEIKATYALADLTASEELASVVAALSVAPVAETPEE